MIEKIYNYLTKKKIIVVTFLVSDLRSSYVNIELLRELPMCTLIAKAHYTLFVAVPEH